MARMSVLAANDGVCYGQGIYSFKVGTDVYEPPNLVQNLFEVYVYMQQGSL